MTQITCTKCDDVVYVVAKSVTLPYICGDCEDAVEFQDKIAPPKNPPAFQKALDNLNSYGTGMDDAEPETLPSIPCDTASVENTTLLIADLEDQLSVAQNQIALNEDALQKASAAVRESQETVRAASEVVSQQAYEIALANEDIKNLRAIVKGLSFDNTVTRNTNLKQATMISGLESYRRSLNRVVDYWKKEVSQARAYQNELGDEIVALKSRGFWARVFNTTT